MLSGSTIRTANRRPLADRRRLGASLKFIFSFSSHQNLPVEILKIYLS
jgi:hypothetical protein